MRISDCSSDVCSSDLPARPLPSFEIATLNYRVHDPVAAAHDEAAIYVPWRSQRLEFEHSSEHPSPLVESAAMAAVALPAPSYRPLLPKRVLDDKILSAAQLERSEEHTSDLQSLM